MERQAIGPGDVDDQRFAHEFIRRHAEQGGGGVIDLLKHTGAIGDQIAVWSQRKEGRVAGAFLRQRLPGRKELLVLHAQFLVGHLEFFQGVLESGHFSLGSGASGLQCRHPLAESG
jgi:hypothetical protein